VPTTCTNFLALAASGYYNNTLFRAYMHTHQQLLPARCRFLSSLQLALDSFLPCPVSIFVGSLS
jgi:hypothetical protein